MWEKVFLKRLRRELPLWVEKGWVAPENHNLILDDIAARTSGTRYTPVAFAVLGVLLFGVGIISFFAANWALIPKLVKLALLFGSMWAAFAGAGWLLVGQRQINRGMTPALQLLGVILYGANIMLIAQIYHIQSHFPNGVLLWTLGALAVTYLVPSQIVAVAGLALGALWARLDIFGDLPTPIAFAETVYWPFFIVLALFVPPIIRHSWRIAAWLAVLAFAAWCAISLVSLGIESDTDAVHILQVGLLFSLAVFLLSAVLERLDRWELFADPLNRLAAIFSMLSFFGLTISDVHGRGFVVNAPNAAPLEWVIGTLLAALLVAAMFAWRNYITRPSAREPYIIWSRVLLVATILLMLVNLFASAIISATLWIYLAFNILYLGAVVWLIYTGYRTGDRFRVNGGFLFFAIGLVSLYFDNFWALLDRSFFFMGAGVLLIGGGFLLEQQRRRLMSSMVAPTDPQPGEGST
ncbi:MAG: DUF2157 domain-containing protein [Alphaproteobacteria bacterium]|nr:DUF2157 domain-containing protein [Alphaproteobacteria bacterium]